jgi:hypothetical protein
MARVFLVLRHGHAVHQQSSASSGRKKGGSRRDACGSVVLEFYKQQKGRLRHGCEGFEARAPVSIYGAYQLTIIVDIEPIDMHA